MLALVALTACAPQLDLRATDGGASRQDRSRAPKALTIAVLREPGTFEGYTGVGGSLGGVEVEADIAMNHLVVTRGDSVLQPQLATEVPSVERGTWRVNADGSMDMTWKLRPNARWHDGAPFTSADLLFAWTVNRDPDLPTSIASVTAMMEAATAPDPLTFVVHWSRTYIDADDATGLTPLPRHLLEDLYRRDKDAFINSTFFTTEYVGLGPYRLVKWEQGSHMEFARFDDYYLGRPPLDRVFVRYTRDPNVMVASILAGDVDAVVQSGVDPNLAIEVKRRWEGTGNQVIANLGTTLEMILPQLRPELARPARGLTERTVRQALYHATDRQAIVEVITSGLAPAADSWISPADARRRDLESSIPQYPYDLSRAQQLLAQAGWLRGPDGILVHNQTGERFAVELAARAATGGEKELLIIADGWKAVGAEVEINVIPPARAADRAYEVQLPGAQLSKPGGAELAGPRLHGRDVATAENRWTGKNKSGYASPAFDTLSDRLYSTIDVRERLPIVRQLLRETMTDVPVMPEYWTVSPALALKGARVGDGRSWNFYEWDKE